MKGWMYILKCSDGSYYTGSTNNLEFRLCQHENGEGANHTKRRLPVKLVYFEEYPRIDDAFYREKQIQGWNRRKKEALINGENRSLPKLAVAYRDKNSGFGSLSHAKEPQPREKSPARRYNEPRFSHNSPFGAISAPRVQSSGVGV